MNSPLTGLGIGNRVLAAPMAGGPSTPEFVVAAGGAGSLGFIAAGYKDVEVVRTEIAAVRASGLAFGVNLFAPNPVPIEAEEFRAYRRALQPEAKSYGIDLATIGLREDDDQWDEKIALLLANPVPVASFTFGIPSPELIGALRAAGTVVVQTVTSAVEARLAAEAGADLLIVQASAAGGHSGTLTPRSIQAARPLTDLIREVAANVSTPLLGAGGIGTDQDVSSVIASGADAVIVGTVLLRAAESGASAVHKAALADPSFSDTIVTRSFTGRPARALRTAFTDKYSDVAPIGYPAVHHLTSPIRRAAAAAGDPQRVNLWAGTGFREATADPVGDILVRLASRL